MTTIGRYVKEQMNKTSPLCVCLCGGAMVLAAWLVCITTDSPYYFLRVVAQGVPLLPTWILGFFWFVIMGLGGCAWGYVLGLRHKSTGREARCFHGSMYFLLAMVFALLWYRLLFGAMAVFLSWLCLLAALVGGMLTFWYWIRVHRAAGVIMLIFSLWLLALFITQFVVILHI